MECVNNSGVCERADSCVTRDIWCELKKAMDVVLEFPTLQDLVDRQQVKPSVDRIYNI